MKVLAGISGGVDSAVAAYLLKEEGYEVAGAMMSIWDKSLPKPENVFDACFGPEDKDIESAKEIAETLKIPFTIIDCRQEYKSIVLEYFKNEYRQGRTPNPCVRCNTFVKFGILPHTAKKSGIIFDKFATGHYAEVSFDKKSGIYQLRRAKDKNKDQTYFLYRLAQENLSQTLFPLASYTKEEVREIARKIGLKAADKPDSQDFYCGDYNDILNFKSISGDIVDKKGKVLGKHNGTWNFTIGQRRGLSISAKEPLYVVRIFPKQNIIEVGDKKDLYSKSFVAKDICWCSIEAPLEVIKAQVRIRQQHKESLAEIYYSKKDNTAEIVFEEPQMAITPGQSAVFYRDDAVLGGGIIESVLNS